MKVTAPTLAEVRRLAGQRATAADELGAPMTAPDPGWVPVEDQLRQELDHDRIRLAGWCR